MLSARLAVTAVVVLVLLVTSYTLGRNSTEPPSMLMAPRDDNHDSNTDKILPQNASMRAKLDSMVDGEGAMSAAAIHNAKPQQPNIAVTQAVAAATVQTQPAQPAPPLTPAPVKSQLVPRPFPDKECKEMYSEHSVELYQSHAKPICKGAKGRSSGSIFEYLPWHDRGASHGKHPSSIELLNLIKQGDGTWTVDCPEGIDQGALEAAMHNGNSWYDSGITPLLHRLRLRAQRPGDATCNAPIAEPALFINREKGSGHNPYHELAQLFGAYVAKHVSGITDNNDMAHNMRFVNFDSHHRTQKTHVDNFFLKAFTKKGQAEPYESFPVGTCFSKAVIVPSGVNSIFWISFGHSAPVTCVHFEMMEGFSRYLLQGTMGSAAVAVPTKRKICYVRRGNHGRSLNGENEFLAKLRASNPNIEIVDGAFGEGALTSYESQIRWVGECAVFTGTHGAGFTHVMFLPEQSVVVEHHVWGHGTFRGIARAFGKPFWDVESRDPHTGNYAAWARALQAAWRATGNFYHFHFDDEFVVPNEYK